MPLISWLGPGGAALLGALLPLILPIAQNLEYEYASLNAYFTLGLFALLSLWQPFKPTLKNLGWAVLLAFFLNFIPGFLAFRLGLCPCAEGEFISFWLLQSLPHLLLGLAVSAWIGRALGAGMTRSKIAILTLAIVFLLFVQFAAPLWFYPQKRSTSLLLGVVHGAIYDNWLPLDPGMLWARLSHGLFALGLLFAALDKFKLKLILATALGIAAFGTSLWSRHYPSQGQGLATLLELMPESIEEPLFSMHYVGLGQDAKQQAEIETLGLSLRFHVQDLAKILKIEPRPVQVFIYPHREAKKLWFGGDDTDITDVVTPSIHITLESWPHSTLRHELVHALSSSIAFHGLGFHPNMAFTEGLAVALAPSEDELSLHQGAAHILAKHGLRQIEALFSPLFWGESGPRAYTLAGSLLRYLIDTGGIDKVKDLYAGASWDAVFHSDAQSILLKWQQFLASTYPPSQENFAAEALFRYPGILHDLCPHSKASLAKSGDHFALRFRQPFGWEAKRDYWSWRSQLTHDPGAQLARLRQQFKTWNAGVGTDLLQHEIAAHLVQPPKRLEDLEFALLALDMLIAQGQLAQAQKEIQTQIQNLPRWSVSDSLTRQFWARDLLLKNSDLKQSEPWLAFLAGREEQPKILNQKPAPWIILYLELRQKKWSSAPGQDWAWIQNLPFPKNLPPTFAREWWKLIAERHMSHEEMGEAVKALNKAASFAEEGQREAINLAITELEVRAKGP